MLDVAVSYNRYKFLGNEFLTWLWFVMENRPDVLKASSDDFTSLDIGNRMVLEITANDTVERITLKGDRIGLEEGMLSMQKGGVVTELQLVYKSGSDEWQFSIKGESLNISGLKTPHTGRIESENEVEGAVLEKVFLCEKVFGFVNNLYSQFIHQRVSDSWKTSIVPSIRKWITS
ncbi:MAG: hypothetical protein V3S89_12115 [Desulfobacterales bacterium]